MIELYLLGHDPLDHFLHPGSLGVQADLLASLFQSGTATPNKMQEIKSDLVDFDKKSHAKTNKWQWQNLIEAASLLLYRLKAFKWGLTWSQFPRSESWQESVQPSQCGGQWVCFLSGCSDSAAPLPGFLLGDRRHMQSHSATSVCLYFCMHCINNKVLRIMQNDLTFTDGQGCYEHQQSNNDDSAALHFALENSTS